MIQNQIMIHSWLYSFLSQYPHIHLRRQGKEQSMTSRAHTYILRGPIGSTESQLYIRQFFVLGFLLTCWSSLTTQIEHMGSGFLPQIVASQHLDWKLPYSRLSLVPQKQLCPT